MGSLHSVMLAGLVAAEEAAHGAEGAAHGGGLLADLGIEFPLVLVQAVGFLLLFLILRALAFRPILGILDQREETIRSRYGDAEKARDTAEELRREYEARIAQIDSEARDRIQDGIREGQTMRSDLLAQAQQERDRIIQQGHRDVSEEREKMVYSVRENVIDMTVQAAGRILNRSMDDKAQRALVQEFLAELPAEPRSEVRS